MKIFLLATAALALAACSPDGPVAPEANNFDNIELNDTAAIENSVAVDEPDATPVSATNYDRDGDGKLDCPLNPTDGTSKCTIGYIVYSVREKCLVDNKVDILNPPKDMDIKCGKEADARLEALVTGSAR